MVVQYGIYPVDLDPTMGHEMKKLRPCIVISPDEMNQGLGTVIVAPLTTKYHGYPTRIPITLQGKRGWVALDQIRTIDQGRLQQKIAKASPRVVEQVKACIHAMLVA